MRITFVVPFVNLTGGIRMVLGSANALHDRGHEVRVVYPTWPYRFHFSRREQMAEFRKALGSPARVPWFELRAELRRVPIVRTAFLPEADVVVATSWPTAHDVARLDPSRGRRVHLVMHHEAGTGPETRIRAVYGLPLRRVTISRRVQTELEQAFRCEVAAVVPCGVDPHVFHPEGVRDERAVLMLLHPDPRKGAADGLAALTAVRERVPDLRVTLCATVRPERWPCWATLVFHPSDDVLRRLYATSAVFLYPSRYEGFGLPPWSRWPAGARSSPRGSGPWRSSPGTAATPWSSLQEMWPA